MKKMFLFFIINFFTVFIFSSQIISERRKSPKSAQEVKKFLEEVANLHSLRLEENQEKLNQDAAEKLIELAIKNKMRELIERGIELADSLKNTGLTDEQALSKAFESENHKNLMAIKGRYKNFDKVLKELHTEMLKK